MPIATTVEQYQEMLSVWFFEGLTHFKATLKANVQSERGPQTILQDFKSYVKEILQSMEPSQEHKMAYLTYVFVTCCVEVEWASK